MEFRGYQGTYLHSLPPVDSTPLFQQYDSLYHLVAKCCAPDPADRFASVDELRTQLLGVLREVVARTRQGTALTSAASVLFESPATARPITEWSQLPQAARGHHRPAARLAVHDRHRGAAPAAEGPRRGARGQRRGVAGPLQGRARAQGVVGRQELRRQPARRRPVGVAGAVDGGSRRRPAGGLGDREGVVQRRLPAGARRARAQAGAGVRLREGRTAGGRRGALPDLRGHRRDVRRSVRVRDGAGAGRPQGHRRCGRRARPGADHQPRLHREPAAARRGAARRERDGPRGARPGAADDRELVGRRPDPPALHRADPQGGAARRRRRTRRARASASARSRRPSRTSGPAWRTRCGCSPATPTTSTSAWTWSTRRTPYGTGA